MYLLINNVSFEIYFNNFFYVFIVLTTLGPMRFIRMVPKLPLDIIVPQYALRRRGAICVSVIGRDLCQVRIKFIFS